MGGKRSPCGKESAQKAAKCVVEVNALHEGHRQRLRRRLRDTGEDAFEDHELLELLLTYAIPRANVNPLAHTLIAHFGSFSDVMNADVHELERVPGMGETSAVLFALVRALHKRFALADHGKRPVLKTPRAAVSYAKELFRGRRTEAFYVLMLDPHHRLITAHLISEGTPNETAVLPRTVVEAAFLHKASAVILAHNHPSGELRPSREDIELTNTLCQAFSLLGICCNEHVIVGPVGAYAMLTRHEYDLSQLQEQDFAPERRDNPHELLSRIRALDRESLGILIQDMQSDDLPL